MNRVRGRGKERACWAWQRANIRGRATEGLRENVHRGVLVLVVHLLQPQDAVHDEANELFTLLYT